MQIRQRGDRMQLIRYTGFNKDKKRADTKLIGSFPKLAIDMKEIPAELVSALTEKELEQLQDYLKARQDEQTKVLSDIAINSLPNRLARAEAAIAAGVEVKDADAVFFAMRSLAAALVKAGHKRPVFSEKASKNEKPDARQLPLVQ